MKLIDLIENPLTASVDGDVIILEAKFIKKALATAAKHPIATGVAALWVNSALQQYQKNKRYTTRFFAKTAEERKLYQTIVDDLMRTGHYKLIKTKFVDGGKLWELRHTGV